ncbi:hypothetical protein PHYBLDRAFT_169891 [Phycomyces blakesleeanus NRRL 1555(-)]|uniref:SWIM-type domain-containing protein n=1 Tax=Phycomyces blakesleeanus (strain ATCC 8743b / DSM 1359 / FGSC 10004 / NBRC 33097 / NRRL 1555) TaxID=763407 RepID=A0A163A9M5_PHYB8|nr:hypothetical protein PHYBLDRAFT_169891 [Phycomyces blakesleeanus NRRL 1555(-)]OAD71981.1 hypothetical protein PHYBLDRAFT_169891 [Phycomyces blakesleeanus NRRL 1555(-)]|eukprot:XP_018290021.1 hypothetical protein PHYBLDRAFT_169891 [Phycomyces blakesleeanus NRRL 1555(-)]
MSTFNIAANYDNRIIPDYTEAVDSFDLLSEDEFTNWLNDIAKKHANWIYHQSYGHKKNIVFVGKPLENTLKVKTVVYLCDHAGKPQVKKTSQPAQKHVRTTKSIKIGCLASIYKHTMTDGTVYIKYNWQHPNHDSFRIEEISLLRVPDELKQWVEGLVSQNMDWKSIKNMLRMSEDRLLELEQAGNRSFFPSSLLIDYQYVRNVVNAEIMKLSRKHVDHYESVKLWVQELNETGKEPEDCFVFTITVRNPITNKGLPVCFFITDHEYTSTLSQWLTWVKVQNSTHASNIAHNSVCAVLSNMIHTTTSVAYDTLYNELLVKSGKYKDFILYFNRIFQSVCLTRQEEQKRRNVYMLDSNTAMEMVEKLSDTAFTCKSFTVDFAIYNIELQNSFLQNCTCPDTSKLCKHIFLINCMLDISYFLRQSLFFSSSAVHVSNTDTKAVVDTSLLSDEIEADIMKYRQLYSVELDSKIAEYKGIPEDISQFLDMLKFAYNKLKEHGSPSQSRPPQQTYFFYYQLSIIYYQLLFFLFFFNWYFF